MQTQLAAFIRETPEGREADAILRSCVHCGFCTATCPTYQLLGDELDGPRGRIYLIKQVLEGAPPSGHTQRHLDRCLTCRSCETTCPSGVRYGRLVDIGRAVVEAQVRRGFLDRLQRRLLRAILPFPKRFALLLRVAQALRPWAPAGIRYKIPARQPRSEVLPESQPRTMLLLDGCVQPALVPSINAAAVRLFGRLGIALERVEQAGCCGAVSYHLAAHAEGLDFMRRNIDAWWPQIEAGAEAIVSTASGCGVMVKEYGELLRHDPLYAEKAARISALTRDVAEVLATESLDGFPRGENRPIAFHSPCTLQHGQRLGGCVEALLSGLGYRLTAVRDAHLCCGSAGTYSILQKDLSERLLKDKIQALEEGAPELIVTANIGCLAQLRTVAGVPVKHWVELLIEDQD